MIRRLLVRTARFPTVPATRTLRGMSALLQSLPLANRDATLVERDAAQTARTANARDRDATWRDRDVADRDTADRDTAPSEVDPSPADSDAALSERLGDLGRRFAQTAAEIDRTARFPFENFTALHAQGLVAAVVPREAGGGGATLSRAGQIIGAVGRAETSTALVLAMTFLVHRALARSDSRWPIALRDQVWQSAVEDGGLVNNLRVEPALGSPSRGGVPATVARRTHEGWSLSGHKLYSTGIPGLRWLLVHARTDGALPDVGTFLVPRDLPGIRVIESWDTLGLRASGSHDVVFDDVRLPVEYAVDLRPPGEWAGGPDPDQAAWAAQLIGSLYQGVASAARDWLLGFLVSRVPANLGKPLSSLPRMQQIAGEIEALLVTNEALLGELARAVDGGQPPSTVRGGLAKMTVSANAIRVVELALQVTGNHGLARRNPLERHHRDVLCSRIHTPQDDAALVAAGRHALEHHPVDLSVVEAQRTAAATAAPA